jgi:hypothetical protein
MAPQTTPARLSARLLTAGISSDPGRLLAAWLLVRTVVWVVFAALLLPNPPLDLVEWLSWGGSWECGYPKHPPLPAWVADLFARVLSPGGVWGVYVASYLAVASCVWAAWLVGRDYLPPRLALVAALALDGLSFLTFDAAEFNNNVMLDAGWAWTVVCFHRAFRTGQLRWWLAVGLAVGLSLLCKYTIGVLLVAAAGYVLAVPAARRCLRTPGPYLAAAAAALLVAPHVAWLVRHDFMTLAYAAERSADEKGWLGHVAYPLTFVAGQLPWLVPVGFVLWPVLRSRTARPESPADPRFLHAVALGPVVILLAISVATGCQLRQIWGSPLWTFAGVWAVVTLGGSATDGALRSSLRRWPAVIFLGLAVLVGKYICEPFTTQAVGRTSFPGRGLASEVSRRWAGRYSEPFPVVVGEGWRAGLICCFAPHRPVLYSSGSMGYLVFDSHHCPWTGDADVNTRGGVVVWDYDQLGDTAIVYIRSRFPRAELQPPVVLEAHTWATVPPVRVGLAFVPPSGR